jgi:hypothetical protein
MSGAIPPLPLHAFVAWCSVEAQVQLYLLPFTLWQNKVVKFHSNVIYIIIYVGTG